MSLRRYERFINRTIEDFQQAFGSVIQSFTRMVRGRIGGQTEEFLNVQVSEDAARELLAEAGYFNTTSDFINGAYGSAVNESFDFLRGRFNAPFRFSDESLAILDSIKETDISTFGQISDDLVTRTGRAFGDWARGSLDRQTFIDQVQNNSRIINDSYLKPQVDTLFSAYNRQVTQKMAEDAGFTKFRYVGPNDSLTRDFCRQVLNGEFGEPVKTIDEWNELNNVSSRAGQPSPVSQFQGGFNCRHNLVPVE